jgi:hypothetical protein
MDRGGRLPYCGERGATLREFARGAHVEEGMREIGSDNVGDRKMRRSRMFVSDFALFAASIAVAGCVVEKSAPPPDDPALRSRGTSASSPPVVPPSPAAPPRAALGGTPNAGPAAPATHPAPSPLPLPTAPPPSQTKVAPPEASSLVPDYAWYVLDETLGATAHDSSSHHFDITNLSNVTWGGGAHFAANGGGSRAMDGEFRTPPITIAAWLTPNSRKDGPTGWVLRPFPPNAVSGDIPGVGGYGFGLNVWSHGSAIAAEGLADCMRGYCVASTTQNARTGGPSCKDLSSCDQGFAAGAEHLVVLTIGPAADGGSKIEGTLYVDGTPFDHAASGPATSNGAPPFYLGFHNFDGNYGASRFFDGRIRDVRIYKRLLGGAEIQRLYAQGPALHAPARSASK